MFIVKVNILTLIKRSHPPPLLVMLIIELMVSILWAQYLVNMCVFVSVFRYVHFTTYYSNMVSIYIVVLDLGMSTLTISIA